MTDAFDSVDPEQLKSFLETVGNIAPTESLKNSLKLVADAVSRGTTMEQLITTLCLTGFSELLDRQKTIGAQLEAQVAIGKSLALELELTRTALEGVAKAIYHYTHEALHTVR